MSLHQKMSTYLKKTLLLKYSWKVQTEAHYCIIFYNETLYLCGELGQYVSKMTGQPWGKTVSLNRHMQTGFGAQCSLLSSTYQVFLFVLSDKEHLHLD
jgi:hypothetical protein